MSAELAFSDRTQRPALEAIYRFKQRLCYLLLKRHKTWRQCQKLIPRLLRSVQELRDSGLGQLVTPGETARFLVGGDSEDVALHTIQWDHERFHNKMETMTRQADGFRNFENYRQRVQVLCA